MNKFMIIFLLISNSAYAFDFKGVEVGKYISETEIKDKLYVMCHQSSEDYPAYCAGSKETIAGQDAKIRVMLSNENVVESISVVFLLERL